MCCCDDIISGSPQAAFGESFQTAVRTDSEESPDATPVSYLTLTTPNLPDGEYIYFVTARMTVSLVTTELTALVVEDGVPPAIPELELLVSIAGGEMTLNCHDMISSVGGASHTVEIRFFRSGGLGTVTMTSARISLWRVS